ncbi:MAG TPA: RagB/SusD family nutrient uptake outer membrane protein [Lacibacter sp.]|nr:RagB/SusD family nutrient uptake outer membrane protein [Lacibacter sp.]HMO87853.1 RagB/SusD family nutrient uptake outer membrane protein [Lacibacter sp.]HMP86287.1 RagB/SusD family nutrient uptake outer membrane protein [Lacibacter sp.]
MKNKFGFIVRLAAVALVLGLISGCKKFLEVPLPVDQLASETVFKDRLTILGAVDGMYSNFGQGLLQGNFMRVTYNISDEGRIDPLPGTEFGEIIAGNLQEGNQQLIPWNWFYPTIFRANEIIERLPGVPNTIMPEAERKALVAAAKYVRAATHFTLANYWGDVPLALTTNAQTNINLERTPIAQVYEQVLNDLYESIADLPVTVNTSNSKTIHNRFQPLAYLSRVHLYLGNWQRADSAASAVISSGQYLLVTGVNNVFRRGSREAIHAWGPTGQGLLFDNRAFIGWLTIPATAGNTTTTYSHMTPQLLANFEPGDQRNVSGNWVVDLFTRRFSNKYLYNSSATAATISANPQDWIYQRLAEIYLIRAEARTKLGIITGANSAASDLNLIRARAGLAANTTATTEADMMAAIEKERVCELFYEGHRWLDLKRWGKLDAVLTALPWKAANHKPHMKLLPIVRAEMIANPRLVQNPGY